MPTARTLNGELTAGEQVLYRVPQDRYAVLVSLRMLNKSGSTATATLAVRTRGAQTTLVSASLSALSGTTNSTALSERMVLEPDTSLIGSASAAASIDTTLSLLEFAVGS